MYDVLLKFTHDGNLKCCSMLYLEIHIV